MPDVIDDPVFNHQRRNVMWLSTLLIVVRLVGAKTSDLSVFGIKPENPTRLLWLLVIGLVYFLWRFDQLSRNGNTAKRVTDIYHARMGNLIIRYAKEAIMSELIADGIKEAKLSDSDQTGISASIDNISIVHSLNTKSPGRNIFNYSGTAIWTIDNGARTQSISRSGRKRAIEIKPIQFYWCRIRASFSTFMFTIAFTEYVLPYLMAFVAIAAVVIH